MEMVMYKRRPAKTRKNIPAKDGYKWRYAGVHHMRFEEPTFPGNPLQDRMVVSNTYDLLIDKKSFLKLFVKKKSGEKK